MSQHSATIEWSLALEDDFRSGRYSRRHRLTFDGGASIDGSPSPSVVPAPWSEASAVDPEEMFVASLSSCHMLWFLHKAREAGMTVTRYRDEAVGDMRRTNGRTAITRVVLRPQIECDGDAALQDRLHREAHEACFIANSVKTEIVIEPVTQAIAKEA